MKAAIVALVTAIALVTSVMAQTSPKILVLPLDGNAPEAQRTALNASVEKLARAKMQGDISVGETTFRETASAVGCDPALAACAELVRTTLAVDELVYGSANTAGGTTTVTLSRVAAGGPPRSHVTAISETDPAEQAETGIDPLFAPSDTVVEPGSGSGSDAGSGSAVPPVERRSFFDTRERKLGVALGGGGIILAAIGLAFWSQVGGIEDDIEAAPRSTLDEINALRELEDEAGSKALWGNVLFFGGVAAIATGGYFLWKDRKNRRETPTVTPAPAPTGTGVTFVLRGSW